MFPLSVAVAQGIKSSKHRNSSGQGATNSASSAPRRQAPVPTWLPEGEYARGMANYDRREDMLKGHIITNRIQAEVAAVVQPQVELFRQQKRDEIDAMSESDLKTLLKSYRNPTPFASRVKKSVQRTLKMRTSNNSRTELIALAKQLYVPSAVSAYRGDIEHQARQAAIARLSSAEKEQLEDETDYIEHERAGNIRATMGPGISPYEWISSEEQASRIADAMGSMGGRRKTRRSAKNRRHY
jgi:hypothetical protein